MKKIKLFALITAAVMLITSVACICADAAGVGKYEGVLKDAKNVIAEAGNYYDTAESSSSGTSTSRSQAFFYDFDNNGTKELAFTFFDKDKNGMPARYLSVYTINGDKPKALIKKKFLNAEVSNPSEYIGVGKKGGKKFLFLQYRNNGQFHEFQTIKYYKIKGAKIKSKYTAKIDFNAKMNDSGKIVKTKYTVKLNKKKTIPSKLFKWQKKFKMAKIKRSKIKYFKKYPYYEYKCNCDTVGGLYEKTYAAG